MLSKQLRHKCKRLWCHFFAFFRQVKPNEGDERKVKNFETRSIIVDVVVVDVVVVSAGTALTKRDWLVTWLTATRVKTRICWSSFSYCQFTSVTQMKGRWTNGFTSLFGFTESVQEDIDENVCYLLEKKIKKWLLTIFENQKKTFFKEVPRSVIRHRIWPFPDPRPTIRWSDDPMNEIGRSQDVAQHSGSTLFGSVPHFFESHRRRLVEVLELVVATDLGDTEISPTGLQGMEIHNLKSWNCITTVLVRSVFVVHYLWPYAVWS